MSKLGNITQHIIGAFCAFAAVAAIGLAFIGEPNVAHGYNTMTPAEIADEAYAQAVAFERSDSLVAAATRQVDRAERAVAPAPDVAAVPGAVAGVTATRENHVAANDWHPQSQRSRSRACRTWSDAAIAEIGSGAGFSAPGCGRLMLAEAESGGADNDQA